MQLTIKCRRIGLSRYSHPLRTRADKPHFYKHRLLGWLAVTHENNLAEHYLAAIEFIKRQNRELI